MANIFDIFKPKEGGGIATDAAGSIFAGGLSASLMVLPDAIASSIRKGIEQANIGGLISANFAPFANFQLNVAKQFQTFAQGVTDSWGKADQAVFGYAKRLGVTQAQTEALRRQMIDVSKEAKFGAEFNRSLDEIIKLQADYAGTVGRNIRLTKEQTREIAAMGNVLGDDMANKLATSLERFGLSVSDAARLSANLYSDAAKKGVSLEIYSKNVVDNLAKAQGYGFKNGVDGLKYMAERAAAIRMEMSTVFSIADKLGSVGGAIETSAQLQVLGGQFAQFANPMTLLYDSLNDVEGLQKQLEGLTKGLASFNRATGEIEVSAFNRMRLKTAAGALGIDYQELIGTATAQARRDEVARQLQSTTIPQEYRELLKNTATFQKGIAGITGANGQFKALSKLNGDDLKMLAESTKTDSEHITEIAVTLRGMADVQSGVQKEVANAKAARAEETAENIKSTFQAIGANAEAINQLAMLQIAAQSMQLARGLVGSLGVKRLGKMAFQKHAEGGLITNGKEGTEMPLQTAQKGEFVVNKSSAGMFLPLLYLINGIAGGQSGIGNWVSGKIDGYYANRYGYANLQELKKQQTELTARISNNQVRAQSLHNVQSNLLAQKETTTSNSERQKLTNQLKTTNRLINQNSQNQIDARKAQKINTEAIQKATDGQERAAASQARWSRGLMAGVSTLAAGAGMFMYNRARYSASGELVMDHSKAMGGSVGGAVGAAAATAALSFVPYVGPVLGPTLGPLIGNAAGKAIGEEIGKGSSGRRSRLMSDIAFDSGTNDRFSELRGNYSVSEMKKIRDALADGIITENDKLPSYLFEKIQTTNPEFLNKEKYASGGWVFGNSHRNGGKIIEAEGGEFVVNRFSAAESANILKAVNGGMITDANIIPTSPMGEQLKVIPTNSGVSSTQDTTMKVEPIDIKINGSLKLEGINGQDTDILKMLIDNPAFINKITDLITKQMNINENGAFMKGKYRQRHPSI